MMLCHESTVMSVPAYLGTDALEKVLVGFETPPLSSIVNCSCNALAAACGQLADRRPTVKISSSHEVQQFCSGTAWSECGGSHPTIAHLP